MQPLDEVDLRLVSELSSNGRETIAALAERVGLTRQAVAERVRRLSSSGLIKGFTAQLDAAALGLDVRAIIAIRQKPGTDLAEDEQVIALMERCPWVRECYHVSGDDCYMVRVVAPNLAAINDLITSLRATGYVENTRTSVVVNVCFEKSALGPMAVEHITN